VIRIWGLGFRVYVRPSTCEVLCALACVSAFPCRVREAHTYACVSALPCVGIRRVCVCVCTRTRVSAPLTAPRARAPQTQRQAHTTTHECAHSRTHAHRHHSHHDTPDGEVDCSGDVEKPHQSPQPASVPDHSNNAAKEDGEDHGVAQESNHEVPYAPREVAQSRVQALRR
jgi:hypothetical protein